MAANEETRPTGGLVEATWDAWDDFTSPEIFASAFVALACNRAISGRVFTPFAPIAAISNDMTYLSYVDTNSVHEAIPAVLG